MKAHIIGGGFGGLAAAAYLIRNAGVSGQDITVYEADERMGGGLFLGGSAESGYNVPGSVFDKEFRCTFDLLGTIPSKSDPSISVKDEFFDFNARHPFPRPGAPHRSQRPHRARPAFRPGRPRQLRPRAARADARSDAGWAAHRRVLFSEILLNRILVDLFDNHGVAAATQRNGVEALPEPHLALIPRSF
jgi:hypothetical protein